MNPSQQPQPQSLQQIKETEMPCSLNLISHEPVQMLQEPNQQKKGRRQTGASSVNNFIQKTFDILQEKRFESIVSWAQNSDMLTPSRNIQQKESLSYLRKNSNEKVCSFKIHNVKAFEQIVLPQYFKHSNMSSFVRQLNMYSFHKVRGDKNQYEFEHELFVKNRPELLAQIKRKQIQSTASIPSISLISYNQLNPITFDPIKQQLKEVQIQPKQTEKIIEQKANISMQQMQSPQKEGEQSIARPSSNDQNLTYRLAQLQQANRNLKKSKQMKTAALRQVALNNKINLASKFNKIVMAIISSKLQQDINKTQIVDRQAKYNLSNLHTVVDHIMDGSEFKSFKDYIGMVYPLFDANETTPSS